MSYRALTRELLPACGFEFVEQDCLYLELWLRNLFNRQRVADYLQREGNRAEYVRTMRRMFPLGRYAPWVALGLVVVARKRGWIFRIDLAYQSRVRLFFLVLHPAAPDPRIHETGYCVGAWRWPRGRFLYGAESPTAPPLLRFASAGTFPASEAPDRDREWSCWVTASGSSM